MKIYELSEQPHWLEPAISYFWTCWGNESNQQFYRDCIIHSLNESKPLPKFYIGIHQDQLMASYALLTNDIISRQDLYPWLACLHVNEEYRNRGYAAALLQHGLEQAARKGFDNLYLSTRLQHFYEKLGWSLLGNGYTLSDSPIPIYVKSTGKL